MKIFSGRQAIKNFRGSDGYAQWSAVGPDSHITGSEVASGNMAGCRVFNKYFEPHLTPKFNIPIGAKFFTAGSCFAREIEFALHNSGSEVLSWSPDSLLSGEFFNRYNTFSIINDFRAAFEGYDSRLVMESPIGFVDYSAAGTSTTRDEMLTRRTAVCAAHKRITESTVLIVTLGLVEVWYDTLLDKYLNVAPSEILAGNLSRFECRITDYYENLAAARELIKFIRSHINHELKIILTVSPVPLNATFGGQDIAVANTFSKGTLRAVAQKIVDEDPLVDYFPSYEIVTLSDPLVAWFEDHRHVRRELVQHIVETFKKSYFSIESSSNP